MKLWKRNAVVAVIVLFVCVAVYLNWSYTKDSSADATGTGKVLGEATLVDGAASDPMLDPGGDDALAGAGDTSAATPSGYFASARLNRQQARDSALSLLQQAATDEGADQSAKDEANKAIQTMADFTLQEANIENLVTAKGYGECVAFLSDSSISVVVSSTEAGLTDVDTAKISEIIIDETGLGANQIKIIEAD